MTDADPRRPDILRLISCGKSTVAIAALSRLGPAELETISFLPFLREACFVGDEAVLRHLLDSHPLPSPFSGMERSLACACSEYGHAQCLRLLLALPAANEDHFNFPYALYCAAKNGHADCARLLLEAGAHPDQRHPAALYSPLKATVACDHVDCALVLLQAGARLDADIFHTELLSAAEIGNPTMVALLLSFGAEPSSQTFQGQSAKQVAKERGHERAAELIEAAERLARAQTEATDLDATLSNNATSLPKPRL